LNVRQLVLVAVAALAVGGTAVAQVGQSSPAGPATPPPPPPPNGNVATPGTLIGTPVPAATPVGAGPTITPAPAATQAPAGRRGRRASTPEPAASASETPEPPQFSTMDGVWEVQLQPLGTTRAVYSHLAIAQKGDQLSGTWLRDNQKLAFTGTFDGRLFKLTTTDGKTTWTFSGYAENYSDMVGLVQTADPKDKGTPFTASHRKKDRL
jgi:outer membrane protein assembly factor BamB